MTRHHVGYDLAPWQVDLISALSVGNDLNHEN